jgi:cytochrome d ubiquinol oxidase subunit I
VGTNLSALWILIANGWMQNPVGAEFSYQTMRMEMTDFWAVVFNPDAQAKFVHTVSAGYVTGAMFVLSVSSLVPAQGRDVEFAKRSFRVAAAFGLASVLSVIVLGDESGYTVGEAQQTKMAALEAMWETEPAPAGLKLIAGINEAEQKNDWEIEIPWVMGLIGTRSISKEIPGIHEIKAKNRARIVNGITAVVALDPAQEPWRRRGQAHLRSHQGRPRLRPAAEEVHHRRAPGHARDDRPRHARHRAQGDADVLELPHHGGPGLRDAAAVCLSFWSTLKSECRARPGCCALRC